MRFLVVDDSYTMRRIVRNTLYKIGYTEVAEAEDGQEALKKLQGGVFDCVITNWDMSNMDGLDLTRSIRKHTEYGALPILMLTARGQRQDVIMASSAGVSGYMVKPCKAEILQQKINRIEQLCGTFHENTTE